MALCLNNPADQRIDDEWQAACDALAALRPGDTAFECQPTNRGGFAYPATVRSAGAHSVTAEVHGVCYAPPSYCVRTGRRLGSPARSGSRAYLSAVLPEGFRLLTARVAA